ncbi:CPBP family intramembrane glutamic endopeptidase [Glaciihabitans sp. dw_435]|uniref:CPBP family intramembrane glutamic endopeptidase n=1 Tax=Glaciihabitans sp. dw_435 TaxID=2720081 RepID=UPI001BD56751|nr:CPBP family intramembrane glutamic endopeptidase [Glaciihabitans sp. dw_435]
MNLQSSVAYPRQSGYVGALRHRPQLWRTLAAVLAGLLFMLVVLGGLAIPVGMAVDTLIGVTPFDPADPSLTTGFWAAGNLLIALLIPVSMLVQKVVYGAAPGTLSSLEGRFRWSVLMRASVFVLPVWVVYTLIMQPLLGTGAPVWSGLNLVLCLVAIATIPLQSAGEEYLFRGLIFRAIGARFPRPLMAFALATAVSALQFGLIHGATDPWGVAYYIAMGISFAVLTERTGGLEVPILIHAVNNTLVLLPVIIAGELASVSSASGPIVFIPIILITVVTLVLWKMTPWLTRRDPKLKEATA